MTPVPGGGGAGGEVRNEPEAPIITRRPQSTNPSPFCPHLVCLFLLQRPRSLAPTDPPGSCRLSAALHVSLPEAETQQRAPHSALDCKSKATPAMLPAEFLSFQALIYIHIYIFCEPIGNSQRFNVNAQGFISVPKRSPTLSTLSPSPPPCSVQAVLLLLSRAPSTATHHPITCVPSGCTSSVLCCTPHVARSHPLNMYLTRPGMIRRGLLFVSLFVRTTNCSYFYSRF